MLHSHFASRPPAHTGNEQPPASEKPQGAHDANGPNQLGLGRREPMECIVMDVNLFQMLLNLCQYILITC